MLEHSTHKRILIQILKDIYSDTSLAPFLGFKGGTAAYLFYHLDRFSTDLDFDLIHEGQEDFVFDKITKLIKNYGTIKEARKKRFSLFFLLSYQEKARTIKIEINRRVFCSQYTVRTFLGISMLVMEKKDMFAHKLVAMEERFGRTNRDIYDVWFFLKNNWPINEEIITNRTELSLKDFLKKCVRRLKKASSRNILSGIGDLLNKEQKIWVKTHLLTDTLFLLALRESEL